MGNFLSNHQLENEQRMREWRQNEDNLCYQQQQQQQQQRATVAAIAAAKELHLRQREREAEQALQHQLEEQERLLLLQAKAQAARRLHFHHSLLDNQPQSNNFFSFHDNDDDDDIEYGYTGSDGYHLTPHKQQQQHHHHRYPVQNKEYTWRELRKADKAYALSSPSRYAGRRKRSRQGKGDLLENDYHAGLSKSEILAMSSERKAAFECQKLRRQQRESSSPVTIVPV